MIYRAILYRYINGQVKETDVIEFHSRAERDGFVKGANYMGDQVTYYMPGVSTEATQLVMSKGVDS